MCNQDFINIVVTFGEFVYYKFVFFYIYK